MKAGDPQGAPVVSEWTNLITNLFCGEDALLDSLNQHIRFHGKEMLQTFLYVQKCAKKRGYNTAGGVNQDSDHQHICMVLCGWGDIIHRLDFY